MKKSLVVLMSCCLILNFTLVQAQYFGNKLKDKLVNNANSKEEKKVDNSVENSEEDIMNDNNSNTSTNTSNTVSAPSGPPPSQEGSDMDMSQYMQMMGGGPVSLSDYPDLDNVQPSSFIGSFDMLISNFKNGKKKDEMTVSWYIEKYQIVMIPIVEDNGNQQNSRIIIDRKKGVFIILMDEANQKMGMIMSVPESTPENVQSSVGEQVNDMHIDVMKNETQIIEGKKCYKVVAFDDAFETESWIAEDIEVNMQDLFGYMSAQTKQKSEYSEKFGNINGWPMQTTAKDKKTGDVTIMLTKNLKEGTGIPDNLKNLNGYQLMKMPDMPNNPYMNGGN